MDAPEVIKPNWLPSLMTFPVTRLDVSSMPIRYEVHSNVCLGSTISQRNLAELQPYSCKQPRSPVYAPQFTLPSLHSPVLTSLLS